MQILMITPSYYPIKGGAETVIHNLSARLNDIGIHTDILTFNMNRKWNPYWHGKIEKNDGTTIYKIPALNWFPTEHSDRITLGINLIPGRFRNLLKDYDILHFHGGDLTLPIFSYTMKKPKIFQSHGFSLSFYQRYFLSRLVFKNIADLYIAISQQMQKELAELGIPLNKIKYLPNSVDAQIFHPIEKKDNNLILFVGRITFGKGLHVLLESLRYLKKKIHLVIIGPPDWDTKYFQKIQKHIDKENTKERRKITYLGEQEQKNIIKWYQKASIFVLPSFREAFPVTILESLSCGTPVVATNVGGIPEVVRDRENGILVSPNDVVRMAEAIQYLLDNEDSRIKFGQNGRKLVVEHFSYDVTIKRLCRIYKEMILSEN